MKYITKLKLMFIQIYCKENDKSLEYEIQLMQDVAKVDLDTVVEYLENIQYEKELIKDREELLEVFTSLFETSINK